MSVSLISPCPFQYVLSLLLRSPRFRAPVLPVPLPRPVAPSKGVRNPPYRSSALLRKSRCPPGARQRSRMVNSLVFKVSRSMGIENLVVSKDAQMRFGDASRSRVGVLKGLQVKPIVPDAGILGKSFHVDMADGVRRDPQSRDHLQQANPLENDLPVRSSRLVQRIVKGRQIEPIHIVPMSTLLYHVTVRTYEIRFEGLRELSCKKGFSRSTEPIAANDPDLFASRTDLSRKGIDIRKELHSARSPLMSGLVELHAQFQRFLRRGAASLVSRRTALSDHPGAQLAERNS